MNDPTDNGYAVQDLMRMLSLGEVGLRDLPAALVNVLETEAWRVRKVPELGELKEFQTFAEFASAKPLEGLGVEDMGFLRAILRDDRRGQDLLDRALQGRHGGDHRTNGNNVPVGPERPEGNTAAKALRRLRKDRPDLHAKVIAKELSPHRAMVEAGFRPRTVTVRLDDPERVAAALVRHLDPADLALVAKIIGGV